MVPLFAYEFDPPLQTLPSGTSVVPQFRGASAVDNSPWYWNAWVNNGSPLFPTATYDPDIRQVQLRPGPDNFPLDPYKAGDAHMRKWDTRPIPGGGTARNWWTYLYNSAVTTYVEDPNQLIDATFLSQFAGPNAGFTARDVRYVNWRFIMQNNVEVSPSTAPALESFSLVYRFER